jgi:hypothetical protein
MATGRFKHLLLLFGLVLALLLVVPYLGMNTSQQAVSEVLEKKLEPELWVADTTDFRNALVAATISLDAWVQRVNQSDISLLCLGESHRLPFREFLATDVFPALDINVLMLEGDQQQVTHLLQELDKGAATTNLAGVDIGAVVRAIKTHNPTAQLVGVDETQEQQRWRNLERRHSPRQHLSRDGFIAQNILHHLHPGKTHVAIFGANHCAYHDLGLGNARPFMRHLRSLFTETDTPANAGNYTIKSVLILSSSLQNLLVDLLQNMGMDQDTWAIWDTHKISPASYNFRWDLKAIFDSYDSIIYFPEEILNGKKM